MEDDYGLEYSDLRGRLERDGRAVKVEVYRSTHGDDEGWILEIVDEDSGNSIVWDDPFPTDQAAHDHLMKEVEERGLNKVIDDAPKAEFPDPEGR